MSKKFLNQPKPWQLEVKEKYGNQGLSDKEWLEGTLDSLAMAAGFKSERSIGGRDRLMSPNKKVQRQINLLSRQVWSLANHYFLKDQGASDDKEWLETSLDKLAREAARCAKISLKHPIYQQMLNLTRQVWNLAEHWFNPQEDEGEKQGKLFQFNKE